MTDKTVLNARATLDAGKYLANAAAAQKATESLVDAIGRLETGKLPDFSGVRKEIAQLRKDAAALKPIPLQTTGAAVAKADIAGVSKELKGLSAFDPKDLVGRLAAVAAGFVAFDTIKNGILSSISAYGRFEQSTNAIAAITGLQGEALENVAKATDQLSLKYNTLAADINDAVSAVGSQLPQLLGTPDKLLEVTEGVLSLQKAAIATNDNISALEAARIVGQALNQFGASADQAARFVNVFAAGTKEGASGILQTSAALVNAGGALGRASITFEQSIALIQTLAATGELGASAGTSLTQFAIGLQKGGAAAKKYFRDVSSINPAIVGLSQALKNLGSVELDVTALNEIFGEEGRRAAEILLSTLKKDATAFDTLTSKVSETNEALAQSATLAQNQTESSSSLAVATDRLGRAFGKILSPAVKEGQNALSDFLNTTADGVNAVSGYAGVLKEQLADGFKKAEEAGAKANPYLAAINPFIAPIAGAKQLFTAIKNNDKALEESKIVTKTWAENLADFDAELAADDKKYATEKADREKIIQNRITAARKIATETAKAYISDLLTKESEAGSLRIENAKSVIDAQVSQLQRLATKNEELRKKDKQSQLTAQQEIRDAQRQSTVALFGEKTGSEFVASDIKREISDILASSKKLAALGKTEEVTSLTTRARELAGREELKLSASEKVRRLQEIQAIEQQSRTVEIDKIAPETEKAGKVAAAQQQIIATEEKKINNIKQTLDELAGKEVKINLKLDATDASMKVNELQLDLAKLSGTLASAAKASGGQIPGFRTGGIVPFTGIAALHGTPTAPEAVLNSRATSAFGADLINKWNAGNFIMPKMYADTAQPAGFSGSDLAPVNITIGGQTYTDTGLYAQAKKRRELQRMLGHGG